MAAKRIKIDNASSKFRRQSQKREQKVILQIERFGFRYCGVIQCRNGARMAFERVPEKK